MSSNHIVVLLVDLVLIMAAARGLGRLVERVGQPPVIGEIAAGILAGPTVLGSHLSGAIFPQDIRPHLTAFANVGVMIFMFVAGLEIDRGSFAGSRRRVAAVSLSAYAAPFALGCGLAVAVLPRHQGADRLSFALFLGCALAVTAFPVLARILQDRDLTSTRIGQLSLACAAIDDILAWCALAVVLGFARPGLSHQWRLALMVPLAVGSWWIVRPLLARVAAASTHQTMILVAVSGALLWGAATEWMGLHLIFGAFMFGVIFPRRSRSTVEPGTRLLSSVFLPGFFVVAGLQVDLGSIDSAGVAELSAIVVAALLGKLGGTFLAARLTGVDTRSAGALAALLNTRGLTELIILNVGLTAGLIGTQLYSMLVLMALVTTAMTAPLLRVFKIPAGVPARPQPGAAASEVPMAS